MTAASAVKTCCVARRRLGGRVHDLAAQSAEVEAGVLGGHCTDDASGRRRRTYIHGFVPHSPTATNQHLACGQQARIGNSSCWLIDVLSACDVAKTVSVHAGNTTCFLLASVLDDPIT